MAASLAIGASVSGCNDVDSPPPTTATDLYDAHAVIAHPYFNAARELALAVRSGQPVNPELNQGEIDTAIEAYDEAVAFDAALPTGERVLDPTIGVMPDPASMSDTQLEHLAVLARGECPPPGCETFGAEVEDQLPRAP
ncbi:MAG: hypothetical protein ACRD0U_13960 [Acidimicrobiales bacterium]